MVSTVCIDAGMYSVGNDSIPQAGPRHRRSMDSFWIDTKPVSLSHLEVFVASGAYFESRWWSDSSRDGVSLLEKGSVDARCQQVHEHSAELKTRLDPRPRSCAEIPAVGLTWIEAAAVCRFYGARLPFEFEWEVAMQTNSSRGTLHGDHGGTKFSRWGCEIHLGFLEEWTASAFTPRHWRDSEANKFAGLEARLGVSLRGSTRGTLFTDSAYRASGDPLESRSFRTFRRVWEQAPTQVEVSSDFRI